MQPHRLRFEPEGTILLGCEVPLRFDCKKPPKAGAVETRLRRAPVFGLLLVHEYVIEDASIERVTVQPGSLPGCTEAKRYAIHLHYYLSHKLKVKIPLLAWGSGDKEWVFGSRPYRALLRPCICCDPGAEPKPRERAVTNLHGMAAIGLAASSAAPGGAIAFLRGYSWWQIGLALATSAVAICLVIVLLRLSWPRLTAWRQQRAGAR